MKYTIILLKRARKFMEKLPQNEKRRVVAAIERLPEEGDVKPMRGHDNLFRLRVGDYRILYTVDHDALRVLVIDAGNRGDVYKEY